MTYSLSFDQRSLSEIAQLSGFAVFLTEEMGAAMQESGTLIQQAAVANTWSAFQNPTGTLASSIGVILDSPFEVQIGVGVPYGRRLEEGFHGADSLGRVYNQAAEPYAQLAMDANQQKVLQIIDTAVEAAIARIGGL